jgi:hypothetical protein
MDAGSMKRMIPKHGGRMKDQAPEIGSPIANLLKAAKRAKNEGDLVRAAKFEQAAHNLDADGDALEAVLRELAKPTVEIK